MRYLEVNLACRGNDKPFDLGYEGENIVTGVIFDYSSWRELYGVGALTLAVQPSGNSNPYPVALTTIDDTHALWTLTKTDLNEEGAGRCQLTYVVREAIKKSAVFVYKAGYSMDATGEIPDPYISYFEQILETGAQVQADAAAAEQAKEDAETAAQDARASADEIENMTATAETLPAGSDATAEYSDGTLSLGIPQGAPGDEGPQGPPGPTGNGIQSTVLNADYTLTITFTDGTTYTTPSIRGEQGEQGEPGVVQDVTVNGTSVLDGSVAKVVVPQITKTVTGNPIVIDDADGEVKSLNVELTPIQDLHGYDKPWAAGAGANKWDEEWEVGGIAWTGQNYPYTDRIRSKNYIPISPNTTYYAKTPTANGNIQIFYYDSNKQLVSYEPSSKANETFTTPSDAAYMRFYTYSTSYGEVYNHDIAINYPSTVTTYSPYENECPISPHTSLPVRDTGKNLFDKDNFTAYDGVWFNANKTVQTGNGNKGFLLPITGGSYVISIANKNATDLQAATFADVPIVGSVGLDFATTPTAVTSYTMAITASANAKYLLVKYNNTNVTQTHTNAEVLDSVQIEHGTTATDYAPYTGQTVTVPLNDLYGGIVDVIGGQDGQTTWANIPSYNGETISEPWLSSMDEYVQGATPTTGAQVTYELATPTPLTTTPTALTLYEGDNVVSSDGDMTLNYERNLQAVITSIEDRLSALEN